ncbi:MAG: magnesium transporter [Phycisphaeraceae bacterium]|nr:magnesium transporter [Phycisphaeraceae bacterium]
MPESENTQLVGSLLAPDIGELIDQRQTFEVRSLLLDLMDPEISDVLMALAPGQRPVAFRLLPRDRAAVVFTYLPPEAQEQLLSELNNEQLAGLFDAMAPDDRAMLFDEMPGQVAAKLLALMKPEERRQTQVILGYPPDSVGRLMTPDYVAIRPDWTVQQVLDHIRKNGRDAETLSRLYVVDDQGRLIDEIRLRQILLIDPSSSIRTLMNEQFVTLHAQDDREKAVEIMRRYDHPALPVVDRDEVLVGIVTFDDVADVEQAETTEDIQKMAAVEALDEPYITMPVFKLVRKRGIWLGALFLGEMLTASAMSYYEHEIASAVVLALFVPLIISSGGNSGSQASTLIVRAMAVGEIRLRDWWRVLVREIACGALLGVFLGMIGFFRINIWDWFGWANYGDHYHLVALAVGTALIGVVLWGSLMGSMLPFLLRVMKLDPAVVSAPMVATLVDVTGLIIYFTVAAIMLKGTVLK